jgi:hypothetical protein
MTENKNIYYFLKDDENSYYVRELRSSNSIKDAKPFSSPEEMVTSIPIMKDWNWDFQLFESDNNKITKVPDKQWMDVFYKWKKENPDAYNKLYNI